MVLSWDIWAILVVPKGVDFEPPKVFNFELYKFIKVFLFNLKYNTSQIFLSGRFQFNDFPLISCMLCCVSSGKTGTQCFKNIVCHKKHILIDFWCPKFVRKYVRFWGSPTDQNVSARDHLPNRDISSDRPISGISRAFHGPKTLWAPEIPRSDPYPVKLVKCPKYFLRGYS